MGTALLLQASITASTVGPLEASSNYPWESARCQALYGPPPLPGAPPITKVCWDSEHAVSRVGPDVLRRTVDRWPAADRGSVAEFFAAAASKALGHANASTKCLSYQPAAPKRGVASGTFEYVYPEGLGLRRSLAPQNNTGAYVIIDEGHRAIYIGNLKSASSTITKKMMNSNLNTGGSHSNMMVGALNQFCILRFALTTEKKPSQL